MRASKVMVLLPKSLDIRLDTRLVAAEQPIARENWQATIRILSEPSKV